jgi:hypothetical protein
VSFANNLKQLPPVSHLEGIDLLDDAGEPVAAIDNKPGQAGSLAVYNFLGQHFGMITPLAAQTGLDLYAEHTDDARAHPGKHPNIDRLLAILETGARLRVRHRFSAV